jgi:hypothetical protein
MTIAPVALTVLAPEPPMPAVHGGRVDVLGRLRGLRQLGVRLQLICWADGPVADVERGALEALCDDLIRLPKRSRAHALLEWTDPPLVRRFDLSAREAIALSRRVTAFGSQALLLESWSAVLPAHRLRGLTRLPLVYRSQNVEVDYWRQMHDAAHGLARQRLGLTAGRIGALERTLRLDADCVLDISAADRLRSFTLGQEGRSFVLPSTRLVEASDCTAWADRDIDILFAGNLHAPNNIEGLRWFVAEVLPGMRRGRPQVRVMAAGSRPAPALRALLENAGVEVVADPSDLAPYRARARVLANPQLHYGGLMQKMLDYLDHPCWMLSTPTGASGMPHPLPSCLQIATSADEFIAAALRCCDTPPAEPAAGRSYLAQHFGLERLAAAVEVIRASRGGVG